MTRALEKDTLRLQNLQVLDLQETLRITRAELVARPKDPPSDYQESEEEYQAELEALEAKMTTIAENLQRAKEPREVELPYNIELQNAINISEGTVVIHYKKEMDEEKYLPLHPEGVKWYIRKPFGEAALCPHLDSWKTRPSDNVKSPFEELRDNLISMMDDENVFTREEKEDWEGWIGEQDKCAEDYRDESIWGLPKCIPLEDLEIVLNQQPQVRCCFSFTLLSSLLLYLSFI